MAEITIRLVSDTETGRTNIFIEYESDRDALPVEHERDHRAVVEALIGKGVLTPGQVGDVTVTRAEPRGVCGSSQKSAADDRSAVSERG